MSFPGACRWKRTRRYKGPCQPVSQLVERSSSVCGIKKKERKTASNMYSQSVDSPVVGPQEFPSTVDRTNAIRSTKQSDGLHRCAALPPSLFFNSLNARGLFRISLSHRERLKTLYQLPNLAVKPTPTHTPTRPFPPAPFRSTHPIPSSRQHSRLLDPDRPHRLPPDGVRGGHLLLLLSLLRRAYEHT